MSTDEDAKLEKWRRRVDEFRLDVPPNCGALWTALGPDVARINAMFRNLMTVEMTRDGARLDRYDLKDELFADFGSWNPLTHGQVWRWVSEKYARSLAGQVTFFCVQEVLFPKFNNDFLARLKSTAKDRVERDMDEFRRFVFDELMAMRLPSPMSTNYSVSEVLVVVCKAGGGELFEQRMPISTRWH